LNPDALGNEFAATLLWEEEIVVALPVGHPLCARGRVTFEELAAEDLIAYRENSALRRRLAHDGRARARAPERVHLHRDGRRARAGEQGARAAVIPRSVAEQPGPPIELRPIGPERLTWPIALDWRASRRQTPAGKAFLKVALDYAERTEPAVLRAA
jgi:DNA-binding transcriptional LysR family regulator